MKGQAPVIELQDIPHERRLAIKMKKTAPQSPSLRKTVDFGTSAYLIGEIKSAETKKMEGFYDGFSPRRDYTTPEICEIEVKGDDTKKPGKKKSGQFSEWISSLTPGGKTSKISPLPNAFFPCSCKRKPGDTVACERARRWIRVVFEKNGKTFDYELYRQQYEVRYSDESETSRL